MLLQIALKVMSKVWLMANWGFLYQVSYFLPLLYGPLIFLFVRNLLHEKRFNRIDLLHFLPFAFLFTFLGLQYSFSSLQTWINWLYDRRLNLVMQMISLLVYHGMALLAWKRHNNKLKDHFSETARLRVNWIKQIILSSFIVCLIVAVVIYLIYITHPHSLPYRSWFVALTVFIYWMSYTVLTKPSIFSVIQGQSKEESQVSTLLPRLVIHRPSKKYSNSGLDEGESLAITGTLQKTMTEQKPFLDPALSINDLAALISCSRHHLSQVLNEHLKQSFYDYVNYHRVEEAKQLLLDPSREDHKIASIAYDAGFNSLSAFNDVFKKKSGLTPSQFRKNAFHASRKQTG
jgi:AraC-like DNA-binding protein